MAVKTGNPSAWPNGSPVFRLVKLLLGEWCDKEPNPFQLLGIRHSVKDLKKLSNRYELSFGDITEVQPGRQKIGAGNSGSR